MQKISILLIEDNQGDMVLIEEELKDSRLFDTKLTWVSSYFDFISTKQIENYDVILLDLTLPDECGESLIVKVLNFVNNKVPVIILTGFENLDLSFKSLDLGVADYLQKDNLKSCSLEKSILYGIQRHKISIKLKESELWFSTLFDKSPLPIIVFDAVTKNIITANDTAIKKYEYSKEEFCNMNFSDLIAGDEDIRGISYNIISQILPSKLYQGIFIHKTKSNKLIFMEVIRKTLKINNTSIKVLVANDVSDKFEIFSKIAAQNSKLREISWFQSHELRAPVSRILGLIKLLKVQGLLSEEEKLFFLDGIYESTEELDILIRMITKKSNM